MNTTDTNSKPFSVGLWDAYPDSGEDACYTGEDFATLDEAQACAADVREHFGWIRASRRIPYVLVSGPGVREVRTIDGPEPDDVAQEREDREARAWRRELATEAGMLGGIDAYNDAMGY